MLADVTGFFTISSRVFEDATGAVVPFADRCLNRPPRSHSLQAKPFSHSFCTRPTDHLARQFAINATPSLRLSPLARKNRKDHKLAMLLRTMTGTGAQDAAIGQVAWDKLGN